MKNNFWNEQLSALLCSLLALCLYLFSLSPSVQGFDSAELTMGAYDLGFVHPPGYPLYLTIGHLFTRFPLGDVGFRMNLMSAVFACFSVYLLFKLQYRQSSSLWTASLFTGLFAVNPAFWSQAIRAEVYTLHIFLMTASLFAWFIGYTQNKKGAYIISFLLLGMSAGNHPTTILLWIPVLLVSLMLDRNSRRAILISNIFAVLPF